MNQRRLFLIRPAGQAAATSGISLTNVLLTLGVIGFFWFAFTSSQQAQREAHARFLHAKAREERHRLGLAATVPARRNPPRRQRSSRSSRSYRQAA